MSILFSDLKTAVLANVFATGEAPNLVASHRKMFVDALIDLQTVVECLQQDNTDLYPQCSTFYDCQMTVLTAPRGNIKSVSVVDKIDPTTHQESLTAETDFCARIYYTELDPCHFTAWKHRGGCRGGGCVALPLFFGLSCDLWGSGSFPFPPTDAGVPPGLPPLPIGFHYPQTSTDRLSPDGTTRWRARAGVWGKERGNIWIAPWIQSTETVIVTWDGIKRSWADDDQLDDDPLLSQAVEEYVRWRHADKYEHDAEEAGRAGGAYAMAKQALVHQCREETRARECEPSYARSSVVSLQSLYYNTVAGVANAACADGSNPVSSTVAVGSVSSSKSVTDANQLAMNQAQRQADALLNCPEPGQPTSGFNNTNAGQTVVVSCVSDDPNAPPPDGNPVTVVILPFTSQSSVQDANNQALAIAQSQAGNQLQCTFWNSPQTANLTCPTDGTITASFTVPAKTPPFSSSGVGASQDDANAKARAAANNGAQAALTSAGCGDGTFWNTPQNNQIVIQCDATGLHTVTVNWFVAAHYVSQPSLNQANALAIALGQGKAAQVANSHCASHSYGTFSASLP